MNSNWVSLRIEEAPIYIIDGDRGSNYPKQADFLVNGHCLFLNTGNVTDRGFDFTSCSFISEGKDKQLRKGKLERKDVILTTRGTVGNVAFYDDRVPYDHIRINSGMVILRAESTKVEPAFLYFLARSELFRGQVAGLSTGSAQPQLPIRDIKRIAISLPPLPEQRAIARILGALDDKIELNRRQNATLEELARAIFKSWFVDFDPVRAKAAGRAPAAMDAATAALFPDSFVEVDGREVPRGWSVRKVGDVIRRLPVGKKYDQRTVQAQGKVPVLDQSIDGVIGYHDEDPGVVASVDNPIPVFANHTCNMRLVTFPFSAIQNVLPFTGAELNSVWVYYATVGKSKFEEYKGHWPDFVIQEVVVPQSMPTDVFARNILSFIKRIHLNSEQSCTLASLRDALLPKLLSGELRVREAERLVAEQV